jgi:hypothetical protein
MNRIFPQGIAHDIRRVLFHVFNFTVVLVYIEMGNFRLTYTLGIWENINS